MNGKQVGLIIGLIFLIPTLIGLFIWSVNLSNDPTNTNNLEDGAELMVDIAVPWWLGIFEWIGSLPSLIATFLIIGFVLFLKWIGEVK